MQGPGSSVPLIVLGETGSGKTALLANVAKFYQDRYSAVKKISQTQQQQTSPSSGQEEGGRKRRFSVADTLQSSLDRGRLRLTETTTLAKKNVRRMSDFVTPSFLHTRSPGHRGRMLRVDDSVLIESEDTSEEGYWSPLPLTSPSLLDGQWLVFYHTVGCIPCSDELHYLLQRLWRIEGLGEPRMVDLPSNPHTLSKVIQEMLATCGGRKFLLIVDSVDRVSCWGDRVSCWGDGVSFWGDGVSCWGDGVSCWGDGVSRWGDGVSCWDDRVSCWGDGVSC